MTTTECWFGLVVRFSGLGAVFALCGTVVLLTSFVALARKKVRQFAVQFAFAVFLFLWAWLFR